MNLLSEDFDRLIGNLERAMRQGQVDRAYEAIARFAIENAEAISLGLGVIDDYRAAHSETSLPASDAAKSER